MKKICLLIFLPAFLGITNICLAAEQSFSDGGGILYTQPVKSVIFRHQYHVDIKKLKCEKCHSGLFEMEALSAQEKDDFVMESLYRGKYCGACHNGKDAFASDTQCARCHIRVSEQDVGHVKGKPRPYKIPTYNTSVLFGKDEMQVSFNHEKHTPPADCRDCHFKLFQIKKGANNITLENHSPSKYCFGCHDGKKTFSWNDCANCHKNWTEIARIGAVKSQKDKSSCYKCHTSDSEMKSLVKAPVIQGEGEG